MKEKKIEEKYKKLDDITHVLLRPGMYISSIKPHDSKRYLIIDGKMELKDVSYIPGFLKIFDEILMNSVDENKRPGSKLNMIRVDLDRMTGQISIYDNGGIDVVKHKDHNEWIPEMIFSNLKAGSNFSDDDNRTGSGMNGVGSVLTNIFSSEFSVSTCDGKNLFKQSYHNNMRERTDPVITRSKTNHTQIKYTPDYPKFGLSGLDDIHYDLICKRVYDIAACNTGIKIFLNGDPINIGSFEEYVKLYKSEFFFESDKDSRWQIGIGHSDNGFQQVSFVNSTETTDGGNHVDYISSQVISHISDFFFKKHKVALRSSDIKNHMSFFINSTIVNPIFSSQTKEKLTSEVKDFGSSYEVSDKMIKYIMKSDIVGSILDWIEQKKNADENKLARTLNKSLSKLKVDKLIDAKSPDRMSCSIGLFEGDSAIGSFRKYRDANTQGAFPLRGKFVNATDMTLYKLTLNTEVVNLMGAIGLKIGQVVVPKNLRYGKIIFYVDSDFDGSSIAALLINFLFRFWPELFENGMVFKAETPLVVSKNIRNKKKISFYTQDEYDAWMDKINHKDWEIEYKKGLAALVDDEYAEIIKSPKLTKITTDCDSIKYLDIWFGKNPDLRKTEMIG